MPQQLQVRHAMQEHVVTVVVAIGWLAVARQYPYGSVLDPGPGFLPINLGVLVGVIGLAALLRDLRTGWLARTPDLPRSDPRETGVELGSVGHRWRIGGMIGATAVFVACVGTVGYGPSMVVLMGVYLMIAGVSASRSIALAVAGTLASWWLFEFWLELPLPGHLLDTVFGL